MNPPIVKERSSRRQLSERKQEILRLIDEGRTSKEVGVKLRISPKTVDVHRDHLKSKLGVTTIAELVQCAVVLKLIKPKCPAVEQPNGAKPKNRVHSD